MNLIALGLPCIGATMHAWGTALLGRPPCYAYCCTLRWVGALERVGMHADSRCEHDMTHAEKLA
jgi:hypothetical protein